MAASAALLCTRALTRSVRVGWAARGAHGTQVVHWPRLPAPCHEVAYLITVSGLS
jgi:hypothetical protein